MYLYICGLQSRIHSLQFHFEAGKEVPSVYSWTNCNLTCTRCATTSEKWHQCYEQSYINSQAQKCPRLIFLVIAIGGWLIWIQNEAHEKRWLYFSLDLFISKHWKHHFMVSVSSFKSWSLFIWWWSIWRYIRLDFRAGLRCDWQVSTASRAIKSVSLSLLISTKRICRNLKLRTSCPPTDANTDLSWWFIFDAKHYWTICM